MLRALCLCVLIAAQTMLSAVKIYDCFPFLNELELLEVRLEELSPYVDKFVIIESAEGFTGRPKPFYFEENKEHFAKYLDKIIYVKVDGHYDTESPWVRAAYQRNQLMPAIKGLAPDDIVIFSDLDEIPPRGHMPLLDHTFKETHAKVIRWKHQFYRWYLNRQVPTNGGIWYGAIAIRYKDLLQTTPDRLRSLEANPTSPSAKFGAVMVWGGGWHFTSCGSYFQYREKIFNFCGYSGVDPHADFTCREQADKHILRAVDGSFPEFVKRNLDYCIKIGLVDPY
ncbi:MAG: hypothetical protein SP1CHLAM54_12840 [Chlamydiia bacterium]|nr:hypothetical protein [Chlamydiia bacterium]MCH9616180.1 hypothetical protein [Chlamydiia bacterium]MCH9629834.1 hypothetical protein [Chlamydiia bacterium]